MAMICGDNRFEIIDKAKEALLESTNIEASPEEMAVLDNFLFRCWQMGWLDKYDKALEQTRWIPVTERLPKDGRDVLVTLGHTYEPSYTDYSVARYLFCGENERHWHDERRGYLEWDEYSDGHGGCSLYKVLAWMPLPEPYKAGDSE